MIRNTAIIGKSAIAGMELRTISTISEFRDLAPAWRRLTDEPLRSFEWNFYWWQSFGKGCDLNIYCCLADGEVVGIAPFYVDRWMGQRRTRFLGSGKTCTDYARIIVATEFRDLFIAEIAAEIGKSASVSLIELEGVCSSFNDKSIFNHLRNSFQLFEGDLEPTWVLKLPPTWTQLVADSKKSLRRKIRKAEQRLESGVVEVRSTRRDLDFKTAFDNLVELHQERFVSKGEAGVFGDPRFTEFLRQTTGEFCQQDRAEILVGYASGQPIVSQLYLLGKSGPQLYQSGVSTAAMHLEPGHLLFTYAIRNAIDKQFRVFDFLRGNEAYKPFWGAQPRSLSTIRLVSKKLVPSTINSAWLFLKKMKQRCRI